eukprot:TRINITY_DN71626_c0_g1_i1.p1 TRINITY_DN71626_c0_g1~~TRINITY_DN71626_c0_g1_i1.p1  ORF type:complete len:391 (+),score=104.99 TRINITY_DN71626_c0_g1_i1:104-1174(+)
MAGVRGAAAGSAKRARVATEGPLRVLVCCRVQGILQSLRAAVAAEPGLRGRPVEFRHHSVEELSSGGAFHAELQNAPIIFADPGPLVPHIGEAKALQWLQSSWAGVDSLLKGSTKRDYLCTRAAGMFGYQIGEYVIAHILSRERRLPLTADLQRRRQWDQAFFLQNLPRPLSSLTLGLLGLGDIALQVACMCSALGMRCIAFRRDTSAPRPTCIAAIHPDAKGVMADSDYVVNLLPSTPATRGLLSAEMFAAGKREDAAGRPPPVLINAGRGDVAKEEDIVAALDSGALSAAVLDVFPVEPLPETSKLWTHDKVTITPHIAALSRPEDVAALFARNLVHWMAGEPLEYEVSWEKGY